MADLTPNLNKRDYLLPPGCKDLIDVLQAPKIRPPDLFPALPSFETGFGSIGTLADIEGYVKNLFTNRVDQLETLTFLPANKLPEISIYRVSDVLKMFVTVKAGTALELALQEFVQNQTRWKISLEGGKISNLGLCCYWLTPLPPAPEQLAMLIYSLFREVCELTDASKLCFYHSTVGSLK